MQKIWRFLQHRFTIAISCSIIKRKWSHSTKQDHRWGYEVFFPLNVSLHPYFLSKILFTEHGRRKWHSLNMALNIPMFVRQLQSISAIQRNSYLFCPITHTGRHPEGVQALNTLNIQIVSLLFTSNALHFPQIQTCTRKESKMPWIAYAMKVFLQRKSPETGSGSKCFALMNYY